MPKPRILVTSLLIGLLIGVLSFGGDNDEKTFAQSSGELSERSAELRQEIAANKKQAQKLQKRGDTLANVVAGLNSKINQATNQIELTNVEVTRLTRELKETKQELERQKNLLRSSMVALYKKGDASTVELLIASDSFSEFMDEQEYLERLKVSIQDSAKKVAKLKQNIEKNKKQQEDLLKRQEKARATLSNTQAQKSGLLQETRGEEGEYRNMVKKLEAERAAVDRQIASIISNSSQGGGANHGVVGGSGQVIGRIGSTGYSFGAHLHFEMRNSSGSPVNPLGSMGAWPASGTISQPYGCGATIVYATRCADGTYLHSGIDIAAPCNAPVVATKPGVITHKGWGGPYGNMVIIKHGDGTSSVYAHLNGGC